MRRSTTPKRHDRSQHPDVTKPGAHQSSHQTRGASVVFDGVSIWVANGDDDRVSKLDPSDGTRIDYKTGRAPRVVEFDGTNIWVANSESDSVSNPTEPIVAHAPVELSSQPSPSECADYIYNDHLPLYVCSQGFSVEMFQDSLGLDADGYFGPGTEAAVRDYQAQTGLPVTGVIDAATWSMLGVTELARFPDLNGDGVIVGSEFPST
jgi:peptidoglycan hydrolase-like protein with peptidoglycan-binding domain